MIFKAADRQGHARVTLGSMIDVRPDGEGGWTGVDDYQAGEPLVPLIGRDGSVHALDIGSFIYARTPYDPAAPVPGGVDASGWQAAPGRHAVTS